MSQQTPHVRLDPRLARLAADLAAQVPLLADQVFQAILAEDAAYAALDAPLRAEVRDYNERNLHGLLAALAGTGPIRIEVPRRTAQRRAAQGVGLGTVLHAYRIGFRVIWEAIVDLATADPAIPAHLVARSVSTVWSVVDIYSEAVTDAYRETLIDLARHDERQRLVLLDALLDGRLADWTALGGTAHALNLPEQGPYLCIIADLVTDGDDSSASLSRTLRRLAVRTAWRLRPDGPAGIAAIPAHCDADGIQAVLHNAVAGRIGLSPPYHDLRDTAAAVRLAAVARASLAPEAQGPTTIHADPTATLLAASPDIGMLISNHVLAAVLDHPDRLSLLETLWTWLSTGESTSDIASRLYCHRNTIRNRLAKIEQLTQRSLTRPCDAAALYTAAYAHRLTCPEATAPPARSRLPTSAPGTRRS
jgi:DNA-binding CsgD family transcriptional regulator